MPDESQTPLRQVPSSTAGDPALPTPDPAAISAAMKRVRDAIDALPGPSNLVRGARVSGGQDSLHDSCTVQIFRQLEQNQPFRKRPSLQDDRYSYAT